MRILIVLALVKILELSRFNLTNSQLPRSFYNLLSFSLLIAFLLYVLLSRYTAHYEQKIERIIQQAAKKWIFLLDIAVLALIVILIYKMAGPLYTQPVRCMTADMLPMIRGAGELLISGENPFHTIFCPWDIGYAYPPMMMVYYLPAILVKIDIRIISLLCFASLLLLTFYYYRKKGFPLTGFLILIILLSSGLFPFLMLSIHTFPYLLILSLLFFSLDEGNWRILFFAFAIAAASQKFFWIYIPFIIIYLIKQKRINLSNLRFFGLGALIGGFPLLLYPHPFFLTYIEHFKYQSQDMLNIKGTPLIVHSLGFSHYLYDHNLLVSVISIIIFSLLFILALKFLKKSNIWLFLSVVTLITTYFQNHTRAQEYYFFPLLVIILFSPLNSLEIAIPRRRFMVMNFLVPLLVVSISIGYPFISGKKLILNPIRGHHRTSMTPPGYLTSMGYLELSIGGNFKWKNNKGLELLIRRHNYREGKPVKVNIMINSKPYFTGICHSRKITLRLDEAALQKHFYVGANNMEIELLDHEAFSVKLREIETPSDTKLPL